MYLVHNVHMEKKESPIDQVVIQAVRASYERATGQNKSFFPDFYEQLISKSPEYERMFGDVEMVHQYAHLYNGILKLFEYAAEQNSSILNLVGQVHGTGNVDVLPAHYQDWIKSLLAVLSFSDPEFTPELSKQWIAIIKPGIKYMISSR